MRPPSVDALARDLADVGLPHPLLVDAARAAIAAGDPASARRRAHDTEALLLRPVVNATGVLLHTNLGRSPLPRHPGDGGGPSRYANVELDLSTGRRGQRDRGAAALVARAVGAEAATVVNNGAAAILLALTALAAGGEVVVSRGELVEIGGGFRIPDVLTGSGARMVEVGTTNRTRLDDYRSAAGDATAALLKVHPSNYRVTGFTAEVPVAALAGLGPPVVVDAGSGLLDARTPWMGGPCPALAGEPGVRQTLEAGAAVVTFSGDKLMGGPQAGFIAGRADMVARCTRHPLARALRPGGLVLGEVQAVALAYLRGEAGRLPLWAMAGRSVDDLRARAGALGIGEVVDTTAVFGGGAQPGADLPSAGVAVPGDITAALRRHHPPVVARVAGGVTVVDLRTVDPADDDVVKGALVAATSPDAAGR